jgi:hypothetical protein
MLLNLGLHHFLLFIGEDVIRSPCKSRRVVAEEGTVPLRSDAALLLPLFLPPSLSLSSSIASATAFTFSPSLSSYCCALLWGLPVAYASTSVASFLSYPSWFRGRHGGAPRAGAYYNTWQCGAVPEHVHTRDSVGFTREYNAAIELSQQSPRHA